MGQSRKAVRIGHREGQKLTIEERHAEGKFARLPALAAELIARTPTCGSSPRRRATSPPRQRRRPVRSGSRWLPPRLPSKVDLTIHIETVKALGLTIPAAVLFRADRLIQ